MAMGGELSWPPVGRFVSAYGEDLMAVDNEPDKPREWASGDVEQHLVLLVAPTGDAGAVWSAASGRTY